MVSGLRAALFWLGFGGLVTPLPAISYEGLDEFELDVPMVLSPVRLHQPLSEVPASVTLITAEQIHSWGIRRLVDVFQYVPGMFVAQELDSNQSSVVYHSGDVSQARRLEVLVDGRSVYKAIFASVEWDQLNIAVDDIERIEITRGASASAYGMNAFHGVINITTRHPADSAEAALRATLGTNSEKQGYGSIGFAAAGASHRVSVFGQHEGEADNGAPSDVPDQNWVEGIHYSGTTTYSDDIDVSWQLGRQRLRRNLLGDDNFHTAQPQIYSIADMGSMQLRQQLDNRNQWQARLSWQAENQERAYQACTPSMAYDSDLAALYRLNRELALGLGYGLLPMVSGDSSAEQRAMIEQFYAGLAAGVVSADQLEAYLGSQDLTTSISDDEYALAQAIAARVVQADALSEVVCGDGDYDLYEQRLELELEYTRWWSDSLRSIQGLTFRRDEATSETYFGGTLYQNSLMAFTSIEYRVLSDLLLFASVTAEHQQDDHAYFSPRMALTYLLDDRSSVRFQYARGHRSADLAERYMDARATVTNLTDNYLGLETGQLFLQTDASDWNENISGERIHSWELGYFGMYAAPRLSIDIKLFHERMQRLINGNLNLLNGYLEETEGMRNTGLEWQLDWSMEGGQKLWLVGMVQQRLNDSDSGNEMMVGAEKSLRFAWTGASYGYDWMLGGWLDHGEYAVGSSYSKSEYFKKRRLLGRLAKAVGRWELALETQYDPLAGNLYFERNPRWQNRFTAEWRW